ncbi:hypothetical protein KJ815_08420 [bacterium]|nr:hypothetical protein [bacterium]
MNRLLNTLAVALTVFLAVKASFAFEWRLNDWVIKDEIGEIEAGDFDLCNGFFREDSDRTYLKITTRSPLTQDVDVWVRTTDKLGQQLSLRRDAPSTRATVNAFRGVFEIEWIRPSDWQGTATLSIQTVRSGTMEIVDEAAVDMNPRSSLDNETGNCAFVHHGNQGLTYTDVFRGSGGSPNNGFDEILELHQNLATPGNFHMSGTLISAAEWYDPSFNQWLRDGISQGWAAMLTSVYAQHIMPFVQDNMNNWAVSTEQDLISTIYGYDARVAWIPERVWLANGVYPDAGIVDPWLGDNWTQHGVDAVILDDWPHVSGNSDRKIHWMNNGSGITLRVIPIDGEFTGNCHYNPGAAIAHIQGTGRYGIVVYGTDWEAAAEMADFSCPDCLENYSQVVTWVHDNYPAVGAWKLDAALANSDFNGWGINVGNGTYGLIGGTDGYGGSNNSWYTHWAGTASHSDFHNPAWNYGHAWWQTYLKVMGSPSNNLSETAWYVMMTNLHETGWHDYMGGPISGWQHRYSSHIKNANVYAEAAHWAAGEYAIPVNAYFADPDSDGVSELMIHNDRVMAVFEPTGGRAQWIFAKTPSSDNYSIVGSCNTYWAETEGDYDESGSNNHQAAFAEVSPHYRNDTYDMFVEELTDTTAKIRLVHNEVTKRISVKLGNPYFKAEYEVGSQTCYLRHGFSPDLLDLIWSADMYRIWPPDAAYMGFRNPNSGATGACILANGGANHQLEFSGTLLRGDELRGYDQFAFLLYTGPTSAPDGSGRIAELETLKTMNLDRYGPRLDAQAIFLNASTVEVSFNESVEQTSAQNISHWTLQGFSHTYSVTAAVRQSDWRRVRLTINPSLIGGDAGQIAASDVYDLNGNVVDPNYDTASLIVPTGLTPHTIVIDGVKDFDRANECLFAGTDTLFLTWDMSALYVGYFPKDLSTGDFFIHIDVNQQTGMGAPTGSWGRESFANPFRIEYQLAIEGGVGGIQLNRWTGSAWEYPGPGTPPATSYNGWSGNPFTEVRIPWDAIGNPSGIALAVSITQEDNLITDRVFPPSNPTGNSITISQMYRLYQPYISGNMPLSGVRPKYILSGDLGTPANLVAYPISGHVGLRWSAVVGAVTYVIHRAESAAGPFNVLDEVSATQYEDNSVAGGLRYFYRVTAKSGI